MTALQWLALVLLCAIFGSIFFTFGRYYQATQAIRREKKAWLDWMPEDAAHNDPPPAPPTLRSLHDNNKPQQ